MVVLAIVQVVSLIVIKRGFKKWGYITKEHGYHFTAVNKILYLHECSLQNHRRAINARQNPTH
jgi:hypothetical protein